MGATSEITYRYANGAFVWGDEGEARQAASDELTTLLRQNPGVSARRFDELVAKAGLGRNRARTFLNNGVLSRSIRRKQGPGKAVRFFLEGTNAD